MNARFTLNGAVVGIDEAAILELGTLPYEGGKHLDDLRSKYRETHFFRREGTQILCVALSRDAESLGPVKLAKASDYPWLIASLVLEALERFFLKLGRIVFSARPLAILSSRPDDLLLKRSLPTGLDLSEMLEKRVEYIFDSRVLFSKSGPSVVVACDVRTRSLITASVADLLNHGVQPDGRYVGKHEQRPDPRAASRLKLLGRVTRVSGETLTLEDCLEGYQTVRADEVFLEPRRETFERVLYGLAPDSANSILDKLDTLECSVNVGSERLRRIRAALDHIRNASLEICPGLPLMLGALLREGATDFPARELASRPTLVFDPGGYRTDSWSERGIDAHGPYDRQYFSPKQLVVALICQAEAQGRVEQFLHKFLEGLPYTSVVGSRHSARKPYEKGFTRRFALERVSVETFTCANSSGSAYAEACRRAIEYATDSGLRWNLALVQIEKEFHDQIGIDNPYLIAKSVFMKQQIPVQEFTIEKVSEPDTSLAFILNSMSVASYAKMGGTPWLLKADTSIAHELVIGLGSYHRNESRLGSTERVVGITTVFTGDGRYLLESRTAAIPYSEYVDALLATLRSSIQAVRSEQNWRPTDAVRLIFHAFEPFKDAEVTAVQRVLADLNLPNVSHAFLHLADDHPFLLFDEDNPGVLIGKSSRRGAMVPERGVSVRLSRREVLLLFTGSKELKQASDGMPRPILLKLHRNSTFTDLTYLARQAFAFSCHSWRSFGPAPLPITILYSRLIARLLRDLEDLPTWDRDAMLGNIGRTLWFL